MTISMIIPNIIDYFATCKLIKYVYDLQIYTMSSNFNVFHVK